MAFNIIFGNTDDHFRNHGFIFTPKSWTLSPAYDINPSTKRYQCLLINENTEASDIKLLLDACGSYMLIHKDAQSIIDEVSSTINDWQRIATENQIPTKVLDGYGERWKIE